MIKIKKLSIAVVALLMCLLLGVTVWSADGNGVEIKVVPDETSFCKQDYDQTFTVTLKASEAIDVFSLQARLDLPDGWSASVSGLDGITYNPISGMIAWIADTNSADNLNVNATELATITITIPKDASVENHVVSLTGIEVTKLLVTDGELDPQYWAKGTNLLTNVAIKEHVDDDKDHNCDACNKTISKCVDDDKNHVCDYSGCKAPVGDHESPYPCKDGICVYCGQLVTVTNPAPHSDAANDEDIACDACGTEWSKVAFHAYDAQEKTFVVKEILEQVWEGEIPVCGAEVADYVENCITYTFAGWENGDEQYPIGTALPAIENPVKDTAIVYTAYYTTDSVANHSFNTKASQTVATPAGCENAATYYVQCDNCDAVSNTKTVSVGEAKGHAWSISDYTVDEDTHTANYVCGNDASHTKSDAATKHTYVNGTCVCGKEEPATPDGLKGDVDGDGDVDMDDVIDLLCHVMKVDGAIITDATSLAMGEVTKDDSLDMNDVTMILQYVMKSGVDSLD